MGRFDENLLNARNRGADASANDSGGIRRSTHVVRSESQDLLRKRGRKHESLSLIFTRHPMISQELVQLRLKSHIKHTVRFVHHESFDATQIDVQLISHHGKQSSRSGD